MFVRARSRAAVRASAVSRVWSVLGPSLQRASPRRMGLRECHLVPCRDRSRLAAPESPTPGIHYHGQVAPLRRTGQARVGGFRMFATSHYPPAGASGVPRLR
jgi:hypothetical protein